MRYGSLVVVVALTGCQRDVPTYDPAISPPPAVKSVRTSPLPSALPPLTSSSPVSDVAPRVARSASKEERERAAWDILAGRKPAADLPVESYDPTLRAPPVGERDASVPVPQVREAAIDVSAGLPPEVVRRILRQNFGRLRLCYENTLRTDPSTEGDVVSTWTIDAKGTMVDLKSDGGSLAKTPLGTCVLGALRSVAFPEPEGAKSVHVRVTHAFRVAATR